MDGAASASCKTFTGDALTVCSSQGWYGFNCCSTLYIAGLSQSVATVAITTTLGAAAGCISATAIGYGMKQYIDPGYVMNGVLAGLVSITSPCAVCSPVGAIIIGMILCLEINVASRLIVSSQASSAAASTSRRRSA